MARRLTAERFIGRSDLLDVFTEMLASADSGRGDVLLIGGEAGVGKSRAIAELTTRAQREGAVVLIGWCVENGEQVLPLAPVGDIMRGIALQAQKSGLEQDALGSTSVVLSRLVPDLVAADPADDGETRSAPGRLFDGVLDAVGALSKSRSVVLVVEDIHWADESTRQLLAFLAPRLADHRVVLIATYRSDELHRRHPLRPFLVSLQRAIRPERFDLQPFTETELAELVESLTSAAPDRRFVLALFDRCAGNAFFAEELIAAGRAVHLPALLRDAVLGRTAGLGQSQEAVLRVAALAGHQIATDVLGTACGMDPRTIADDLDVLVENGLLIRTDEAVRFRHELAREIVESEILGVDRVGIHQALATTLLKLAPERAGDIARHWMLAGDQPRALVASISAGRGAAAVGADSEALLHLERALELWPRVPDAEQLAGCSQGRLLLEAADTAGRARSFSRASSLGHRALAMLSGDPVDEGIACLRLADWTWWDDKADAAERLIERAVRVIPAEPPTPERALAVAWDAMLLSESHQPGAEERQVEALALARHCGARRAEVHVLTTIGTDRCTRDDPGGLDLLQRAIDMAATAGLTHDAGRAFDELAFSLTRLGRYPEVIALERQALDYCAAAGLQRFYGVEIELSVIRAQQRLGRWADAEVRVARLRDEFGDLRLEHFTLAGSWGLILVRQGRLDGVSDMVSDAIARMAGHPGILRQVAATAVELAAAEGRVADIPALVETALDRARLGSRCDATEVVVSAIGAIADQAPTMWARSSSGAATALRVDCAAWLQEADEFSAETVRAGTFPELTLRVGQARAEFTGLQGEPATEQWRSLVDGWDGLQMPYEASHARWRLAHGLLSSDVGRTVETRSEARALLTAARESAAALGAVVLIQGVDKLDRRAHLGITAERERSSARAENAQAGLGLTDREAEVLRLVAAGYSNGQIGQALYISRKTASVHVSNILRKLGVSGRVEAAAIAAQDTRSGLASGQPSGR